MRRAGSSPHAPLERWQDIRTDGLLAPRAPRRDDDDDLYVLNFDPAGVRSLTDLAGERRNSTVGEGFVNVLATVTVK